MAEDPTTFPVDDLSQGKGASAEGAQLHDLLPFTINGRIYAVFTEQVDGTAEGKSFARLPRAPQAVIGVVCVRGRMLTVLDPAVVLNGEEAQWEKTLPYVIILRSDEQLGLVAETCRDTITISAADIEHPADDAPLGELAVGLVRYAGEEMVILDGLRLFSRAVQRRERRRRRF